VWLLPSGPAPKAPQLAPLEEGSVVNTEAAHQEEETQAKVEGRAPQSSHISPADGLQGAVQVWRSLFAGARV